MAAAAAGAAAASVVLTATESAALDVVTVRSVVSVEVSDAAVEEGSKEKDGALVSAEALLSVIVSVTTASTVTVLVVGCMTVLTSIWVMVTFCSALAAVRGTGRER